MDEANQPSDLFPELDAPEASEEFVSPDDVSITLYNLLDLHNLRAHNALRLLSREELEGLCGIGNKLADLLQRHCAYMSITLRDGSFQARATLLYKHVYNVPVSVVLSIVFSKKECNKNRYRDIRDAVLQTGASNVGELLEVLARAPQIAGITEPERARLRNWLCTSVFW
ncbi:MAG TPA: hypothetical protein VM581_00445 [Magnetospirillaceae bacterium]|nr:hypothetical protein [Magnetospirillaceae bacterium]